MAVIVHKIKALAENLSRLSLELSVCAYAEVDQKWNGKQVCSPFNRIYILEQGEGVLEVNGQTVVLQPGKAYLLPAGLSLDFYCPETMRKWFFHVNVYKPDRYDLFLGMNQVGVVDFPVERLSELKKSLHGGGFAKLLAVKQQLYRLICEFACVYLPADETVPVYSAHVMDTVNYIRDHLSAGLRLEELAARLFVSRSYLSQQFRREIGVTVGKYISDQLMTEAQKRLTQTRDSVGEISRSLGFEDQCYFSRRFKQLCGLSPLQYRSKTTT